MSDFTTLFADTLNSTISKMVADAVAAQTAEIIALRNQVKYLEDNLEAMVEKSIENYDFSEIVKSDRDIESVIEACIENYDFTEIVKQSIDTDGLFEGREFDDAVKDVIASALTR